MAGDLQPELLPPDPSTPGGRPAQPLAARMRPRTLDEFVGQQHLAGPGRVLRRAVEAGSLPSMVLWGPPGTGKTTLAELLARAAGARFVALSAVSAGVADLRREVEAARRAQSQGQRTILFIDEIHRFNKAQQDAILPHVEQGVVVLIGATTENPSFEVNSALLSRGRVYTLRALTEPELRAIAEAALADLERGLAALRPSLEPEALDWLIVQSNGDARVLLNTLELAVVSTPADELGQRRVDRATLEDALQRRSLTYDRAGDVHYDVISAFIKSIRGSDPDAAVYWLARMLDAGEDLMFIARRLVILASEDVGLADSQALPLAVAAQQAAHFVGLPEAFYPLAHATLYLALAAKSNSVGTAYSAALADVDASRADPVPLHLRNAPTGLMRSLGYGRGYRYAHEYEGGVVEQQHLPDSLAGRRYFVPTPRDRLPAPRLDAEPPNSAGEQSERE